jgi:hypothetical protein
MCGYFGITRWFEMGYRSGIGFGERGWWCRWFGDTAASPPRTWRTDRDGGEE